MTMRFIHTVACDDIRVEDNGKYLIIGMYTGGFVPSSFPVVTQLSFATWARLEKSGTFDLDLRLFIEPGHKAVGGMSLKVEVKEPEDVLFLPLAGPPINIGGPGELQLIEANSEQTLLKLPIGSQGELDKDPATSVP